VRASCRIALALGAAMLALPFDMLTAQSRTDSIEILKQLAPEVWKTIGGARGVPDPMIAADELTRAALDSFLVAHGTALLPPLAKDRRTTCPYNSPDPRGPQAWIMTLKVFELKGDTAKAGFVKFCGHGEAPGTAFASGADFRLRRVDGHWVLGEALGGFISSLPDLADRCKQYQCA
jgi:hypothetical protein